MLVLARKVRTESIRITVPPSDQPQVIDVSVVRSRQGVTWLGFEAPREVQITRTELLCAEDADLHFAESI